MGFRARVSSSTMGYRDSLCQEEEEDEENRNVEASPPGKGGLDSTPSTKVGLGFRVGACQMGATL